MTSGRVLATYHLGAETADTARDLATAIAREQTIEAPPGVGGQALQERCLGRLERLVPAGRGGHDAILSYSLEVTGTTLVQVVNVLYGNVSLMNGVRLVEVNLPTEVIEAQPGPRLGIAGIRDLVGAVGSRPLVATAIKPVGLSVSELSSLASTFATAGVDVVKDDHGLADQRAAPFRERVIRVAAAVAEANVKTGGRTAYFPNVTGPIEGLDERLAHVEAAGCPGVVLCPSLLGLDVMRAIAARPDGPAIMAHPTHGQAAPGRSEGVAPEVLFGTLYRMAGADVVVYVNAGGRFAWPVETCEAINARLRAPLGALRPSLPAPAGGVDAARAAEWLGRYGPDTMLLIGGSLLAAPDLLTATRKLVATAGR